MNVASSPNQRRAAAELDPFEIRGTAVATTPRPCRNTGEARVQAGAEFGCVDWYQYQVRTDDDNDALKKVPAAQ